MNYLVGPVRPMGDMLRLKMPTLSSLRLGYAQQGDVDVDAKKKEMGWGCEAGREGWSVTAYSVSWQ